MTDSTEVEKLVERLRFYYARNGGGLDCRSMMHSAATMLEAQAADIARKDAALNDIVQWAEAYPLKVFPEPELTTVVTVLEAGGLRGQIDRLHGSWGRRLLMGVGGIASAALAATEPSND